MIPDPPGFSVPIFHPDEEILEALTTPKYPWDDPSFVLLAQDAFTPKNPFDQYVVFHV